MFSLNVHSAAAAEDDEEFSSSEAGSFDSGFMASLEAQLNRMTNPAFFGDCQNQTLLQAAPQITGSLLSCSTASVKGVLAGIAQSLSNVTACSELPSCTDPDVPRIDCSKVTGRSDEDGGSALAGEFDKDKF